MLPLPTKLVVWAHKSNDADWSEDSYHRLHEVTTAQDMWGCLRVMHDFMDELMFFVMVGDAVPRWEHESNVRGGYYSVRADAKNIRQVLESIVCKMVAGVLIRADNAADAVAGVSTSSKGKFSIIKTWMTNCDVTDSAALAIDGGARNTVRFTPHIGKSTGDGTSPSRASVSPREGVDKKDEICKK